MAKYSNKVMGKEVGQAEVYAEPHTMSGKEVKVQSVIKNVAGGAELDSLCMSVGSYVSKAPAAPKTSGIKVRGTGAATKGLMARGPMA